LRFSLDQLPDPLDERASFFGWPTAVDDRLKIA
jgi:hypothetical protein